MSVRLVATAQAMEGLVPHWMAWQDHVNNDIEQFRLVCRLRPEVEAPLVLAIERAGVPVALLAARVERTRFAPSLGYWHAPALDRRVLCVLHHGTIGAFDAAAAGATLRFLRQLLRAGVADAVAFHPQVEPSPLLAALRTGCPRWLRASAGATVDHHAMSLGWPRGGFLDHKFNAKHRSRLRGQLRDLAAAYPGRLAWTWVDRCDDVPALCARLEPLAARTYQRGIGAGFVDDAEYRSRFALFAQRGQLRLQLLEIDGAVRGFWYGFVYQGVFHAAETGYDPALARYEVGTQLLARLADALAAEGVRELDFGIGDAPYKARFGDRHWREAGAWLFAATPRGVSMHALLAACGSLDAAARGLARRAGLLAPLKTWWRRRLRPSAATPTALSAGLSRERTGEGNA